MGMSKVQLWEIETNPSPNPRLTTLMAIAKATNAALSRVAILAAKSHEQENATEEAGAAEKACRHGDQRESRSGHHCMM